MLTIYSSLAAALLLASPLLAAAQLSYPTCPTWWSWSFNSLGQSPCAVAAQLQGVCDNGKFSIPSLVSGDHYVGPGSKDSPDMCTCNTVVYSLVSACGACQNGTWLTWNAWTVNCSAVDPPSTFSNAIPNGTKVPAWAFLNVTEEGTWDPDLSYDVGDSPEVSGATLSPLSTPTTTQTSVPSLSPSQSQFASKSGPTTTQPSVPGLSSSQSPFVSKYSHHSNKTAAIVGGVLGGIVFIVLTIVLMLWRQRIKRRRATRAAAASILSNLAVPLQDKVSKRNQDDPPPDNAI